MHLKKLLYKHAKLGLTVHINGNHDLFQKIFLGPLLQDDEIFGGVSEKVMGMKKNLQCLFWPLLQDDKICYSS
jgi:hypothetical protein